MENIAEIKDKSSGMEWEGVMVRHSRQYGGREGKEGREGWKGGYSGYWNVRRERELLCHRKRKRLDGHQHSPIQEHYTYCNKARIGN